MGLLEEESQAANGCRWLSLGIHVITPNKRMGSGPLQDYLAVKDAQRRYGVHFLAEVCSLLPHKREACGNAHPMSHSATCFASCPGCHEECRSPSILC